MADSFDDFFIADDRRTVSDGHGRQSRSRENIFGLSGSQSEGSGRRAKTKEENYVSLKGISKRTRKLLDSTTSGDTSTVSTSVTSGSRSSTRKFKSSITGENDSYRAQIMEATSARTSFSSVGSSLNTPIENEGSSPIQGHTRHLSLNHSTGSMQTQRSFLLNSEVSEYNSKDAHHIRQRDQQQLHQPDEGEENISRTKGFRNSSSSGSSNSLGPTSGNSSKSSSTRSFDSPNNLSPVESPAKSSGPTQQAVKINSFPTNPSLAIHKKLHPTSPSHALDPLACESRDSEEEIRLSTIHRGQVGVQSRSEMLVLPAELTFVYFLQIVQEPIAPDLFDKSQLLQSRSKSESSIAYGSHLEQHAVMKIVLIGDSNTGKTSKNLLRSI